MSCLGIVTAFEYELFVCHCCFSIGKKRLLRRQLLMLHCVMGWREIDIQMLKWNIRLCYCQMRLLHCELRMSGCYFVFSYWQMQFWVCKLRLFG